MQRGTLGPVGRYAVAMVALVAALAACTGPSETERAADALPDLSADGLEQVDCAQFSAQDLQPIDDPYVRECWTGAPDTPFDHEADAVLSTVTSATDAEDVTRYICPDDVLIDAVAYACRAAADGDVMYRVVVSLPDPASIVAGLPDEPTEDQIETAVSGAPIQVVVQTEETPKE